MAPDFESRLQSLRQAGLFRRRRLVDGRVAGPSAIVDGRELKVFCSNDYLGLASDPRLAAALADAAREIGTGSGASHLITGHHRLHLELEEALAAFTGRDRALLFSTGYMANLSLARSLVGRDDTVIEDRLNHASLLDAGHLSGAKFARFPHADVATLDSELVQAAARGTTSMVLTDGVFSMDGDLARLPALAATCARHGALLGVDDAHGLGVLGHTGRGTLEHFGMDQRQVPFLVGTLGKAFGTFGAFVAGPADLIELLIQRGRTYIYTTALPPALAAATLAALRIAEAEPWRRQHVLALAARFRELAAQAGLPLVASTTPIQPVVLGDPRLAVSVSNALQQRGFLVAGIRPPTVPAGTSRLRVTLSAAHQESDVERLVGALADIIPGEARLLRQARDDAADGSGPPQGDRLAL